MTTTRVTSRRCAGPGSVTEHAAGRSWRVSGTGFWQIHPAAAQTLVDAVMAQLAPVVGESALDLFCGVGLFAGVAGRGRSARPVRWWRSRVTGRPYSMPSTTWPTCRRYGSAAGASAPTRPSRWLGGRDSVDLVVLDPPRTGAGPALCRELAGLAPRAICYVACDPAALGPRHRRPGRGRLRPGELVAFDLFPMTSHVECVALFVPIS